MSYIQQQRMEAEVDISQIMQVPEEIESHFLELKPQRHQAQYVQSKSFKKLFYSKRTMRQLLEERTNLCFELGLSSRNGKGKGVDIEEMEKFFGGLFKDCPDNLTEFSWTVVQDRGTVYGFLASEDKMVPVCKSCNRTVYVSMRGPLGRIGCSNPVCKIKLLGQFQVGGKPASNHGNNSKQHQSYIQTRDQPSKGIRKSEVLQSKNQEIRLSLQDRQLIKRAAKRFVN